MRFARVAAWAWLACLAAAPIASHAEGASAGFEIRVTLHNGAGSIPGGSSTPPDAAGPRYGAICTSQARGNQRTALVEVLCSVGPFVSIAPVPGQSLANTDEPWRYDFGPQASLRRAALAAQTSTAREFDSGTLTALQVTNASGDGSALEMLVSF